MTTPGADLTLGTHLMLAFEGTEVPDEVAATITEHHPSGFTLFPHANVAGAEQVAELTASLQRLNPSDEPLLIAADQETGQLLGLGPAGTTPFAGNMALGATGDPDLAREVGRAIGREMRALGVNLNYAPVCDVATNPDNPSLGIRAFAGDAATAATMTGAMVTGLQEAGVIATAKHFPGKGEAVVDPHYELPSLDLDLDRLHTVELAPFRAAIDAGVGLIMSGHYSVPAFTGRRDLPSTLSPDMITRLLRNELGFDGVVITDALNMGALTQGVGQVVDVIAALAAGVDLLLCTPGADQQTIIRLAVELAVSRGLLSGDLLAASAARITALRRRVGADADLTAVPGLDVVGCQAHLDLATTLAGRSITLVRDDAGLLPLRPGSGTGADADAKVLAVMPEPKDLTPADTSSLVTPGLAAAVRRHHPNVTEIVTSHPPTPADIAGVVDAAAEHDVVIVGTISATAEQADLVNAVLATGTATVTVALRTPYDLPLYPRATTHLATYSILPGSLDALADVLFGQLSPTGHLPAAIGHLHPAGHSLTLTP